MTPHSKPSPVNEKRPAEAGRQAEDAIPGGAAQTDPSKSASPQVKNPDPVVAASRVIAYIDGFNLYFGM